MPNHAYFNENEPAAAHVLECLIKEGVIADGVVDRRSIADVEPKDVAGFRQAHFFAGGGLWSVAARLAQWPDDRPLWTGSCPCQPFSVAGKGLGEDDPRHLWPHFFRLIAACRPPVVVGEQVSGKAGYGWFDGVAADLEGEDYACRAVDIPACAVDAPHTRQRLYWCAVEHAARELQGEGRPEHEFRSGRPAATGAGGPNLSLVDADSSGRGELRGAEPVSTQFSGVQRAGSDAFGLADASGRGRGGWAQEQIGSAQRRVAAERSGSDMADSERGGVWLQGRGSPKSASRGVQGADGERQRVRPDARSICGDRELFWSDYEWRTGADGKARRVKPGVRLLVDGYANRVAALRIAGNAIVAPLAAQVLEALMESLP